MEWLGNSSPDPFWLFLMLAGIVLCQLDPVRRGPQRGQPRREGEAVAASNLLSPEGLRKIVSEAVTNLVESPPLGLVIMVLLGVAVAEQSG
ncbi:AbgT family transporter [Kocuria rhizophila]|nr:AbgT family transporter [Kocuria rhizophila]